MNAQTWLWLTTVAMAVGGGVILATGARRDGRQEAHTIISGIVPLIAACAYFAMAVGQGSVVIADGTTTRLFYFARYIDWSITTPLLLLGLAMTAMHSGMRRWGAVGGMLLADLMMLVTGFAFAASTVPWIKLTWFIISCGFFLAVLHVLRTPLGEEARKEPSAADYGKQGHLLTVLWLVYPVVVGLSPDGLNWIGEELTLPLVAIVDVVSKVGFGLIAVRDKTVQTEVSEQAGGRAAA